MKQFKGYIITSNKSPIAGETFKNKTAEELRSFEEVKNLSDYAGIIEDGYVIVDVDDEVQSNKLLNIIKDLNINTIVYKTTRGMHFYFKVNDRTVTNKVGTFTAVGLKVDMKLGSRNSYVCLKHQGVEREIIYYKDTIDEIPIWLSPISYTFPFLNMETGDGRNQSLFNYILILQSHEFSKSQARETLRLINSYILEDKLSDNELETLMRDEAFSKQTFFGGKNGNTFLFDKFAKYLISEHNIIRLNDHLHIYRDGIYVEGDRYIGNQMIQHIPNLKNNQRVEVLKYIETLILDNERAAPARYIAFKNGIYDIVTRKLEKFNPDLIMTNKIPWNYNPAAYSELADKTLDKLACNDKEIRMLIEEMIGYTFYRRNEMRTFFIILGGKRNGKSTLLRMIQNLLGYENTSSLDLGELSDRFRTAELFGKLANIGDDVSDQYIRDPNQLKKLSAGNTVTVERKGEDPFQLDSYAKLIFSANKIPRISDPTGATQDRMIIIPFNNTFTEDDDDYNPFLRYELEDDEVMEYLINVGLEGLMRILKRDGFIESKQVKEQMIKYELENNPIKQFILEVGIEGIENQTTASVYSDYNGFCVVNNYKPVARNTLTRTICEELNLESNQQRIDGRRVQVYTRI